MFKPISGGTTEEIQGLKCHIPKVGYIYDYHKKAYDYVGVIKRAVSHDYQFWERDKDFDKVRDWELECKRKGISRSEHQEYSAFIKKCWKYRLGGCWFYNNGVPTYITGKNWFFLSCYTMDVGYPKYRDIDRQYFYAVDWSFENPNCYGLAELTKRRCFAKDTKVIMFDGTSKAIQDIIVGDEVMGDDSTIRNVVGVTSGVDRMYKITPNRGESFTCNEEHTLCLFWNNIIKNTQHGWEAKSYVTITVNEYLKLKDWEKEHLVLYSRGWGDHFEIKEHFIPPYIFGAWLGDGDSHSGHFTAADEEVLNEFREYTKSKGLDLQYDVRYHYRISKNKTQDTISAFVDGDTLLFPTIIAMANYFGLAKGYKMGQRKSFEIENNIQKINNGLNPHRQELIRLGVQDNKHIPQEYLTDSYDNRMQLLAGIIDTDGYLSGGTYYEITQKSKQLSEDIAFLSRSLGFHVSMREKIARMKREDGSYYECLVYRMSICGDIHKIPCRIERKKAGLKKKRVIPHHVGFKVEYVGEDNFYGFELDGNHKFILHIGFISHNCGKSFRSGCIGLEMASRTDNFNVGIQSKADTDAEKFFKKNIVNPFRKFPPFFKPETNLPSSGKAPLSELKFENAKMLADGDELASLIDYQASTINAYDGQKLGLYIGDEAGKVTTCNINDRWDIIKFCLMDEEGKIIGKTIHTTTVEKEKNKKGISKQDEDTCDKNYLQMWNRSNQHEPELDGTTKTGIIRFFMSAQYTRNIDKFGKADEKAAIDAIMRARDKEKDNPRSLANLIRKEPITEREAFQVDGDNCIFGNPVKIQQRYDDLLFLPKQYKVGNFHWEYGIRDGAVYFEECEGGRFMVAHEPPEGGRNLTIKRSYSYVPNNKENYVAGIDPVDYKVVSSGNDKRMSYPSLSIIKKEDPINSTRFDNNLVCLYLFRPQLPEIFYEDCIKALKYYGCEALIERNKGNIITYFEEQGYAEYAAWLDGQNERGIYNTSRESGGGINGKITEIIDQWTEGGLDGCVFPILLEQLLIFDPMNTTKFDAAMSFGYALMLLRRYATRQKRANKMKQLTDVSGWF